MCFVYFAVKNPRHLRNLRELKKLVSIKLYKAVIRIYKKSCTLQR
jgi:hypothetical protein